MLNHLHRSRSEHHLPPWTQVYRQEYYWWELVSAVDVRTGALAEGHEPGAGDRGADAESSVAEGGVVGGVVDVDRNTHSRA